MRDSESAQGDRVWIAISLVTLLIILLLGAYGLRRYVCFRRKDCCGQGCGCLFPKKARREP